MLFFNFIYISCFLLQPILSTDTIDCYPWENDAKVCKCNETHCDDTTKIDWCPEEGSLLVYLTSDAGARLRLSKTDFNSPIPSADAQFTITIDPCTIYQTWFGFGGALTDSAALTISCLPEPAKMFLMNNYFNCEVGLAYNMIRINVGACDFSPYFYTYCDSDTSTCSSDPQLSCFNLHPFDTDYKIPLLQLAQEISCTCINIKIATWNAPEWMTNQTEVSTEDIAQYFPDYIRYFYPSTMTKALLKDECFETWANYYIKTIEAFQFCDLNCSLTISLGNEPFFVLGNVSYTQDGYEKFLVDYLCPKIRNLTCINPIRILVLDDQTSLLPIIQKMLANETTKSCIDSVGTHFYLDFQGSNAQMEPTRKAHETFYQENPGVRLWRTQSSILWIDANYYQPDWQKAVKYSRDIFIVLNGNVEAYFDWNLSLDLDGGPNWQNTYSYAPVKIDCERGEFYKYELFYVLGHFSKFLIPGSAIRVDIIFEPRNSSIVGAGNIDEQQNLFYVAFKVSVTDCAKPNLVVIILNTNDWEINGDICIAGYNCATLTVPPKSIISTVSLLEENCG